MKLILAIINGADNDNVTHALTDKGFKVTCIASTGGLFRPGQSTLLIGIQDEQVDEAFKTIREACSKLSEPDQHSGIMFVLKVDNYTHF